MLVWGQEAQPAMLLLLPAWHPGGLRTRAAAAASPALGSPGPGLKRCWPASQRGREEAQLCYDWAEAIDEQIKQVHVYISKGCLHDRPPCSMYVATQAANSPAVPALLLAAEQTGAGRLVSQATACPGRASFLPCRAENKFGSMYTDSRIESIATKSMRLTMACTAFDGWFLHPPDLMTVTSYQPCQG
jgi:hypothetical protein